METEFAADMFNCEIDKFMFVCGYPKFVYALVGNINYPDLSFFPCVFGFEIEREFPVSVYI